MLKKLNKFLLVLMIIPCVFLFASCKETKPQTLTYTISYELNGGENAPNNPTSYNSDVQNMPILDATRENYDFAGWFTESTFENRITAIKSGDSGDKIFYAKWTPKAYKINYELNGGTQNPENLTSYNIESSDIALKNPTKEGYTFVGWFADESLTNKVEKIEAGSTGDKTFYAKWDVITYSISYELDGGTQNPGNVTSYTILDETISLLSPSKFGYNFLGWFSDDSATAVSEILAGSTGNKTFYARWQVKTFTLSFDYAGADLETGVQSKSITFGEKIGTLPVPSKTDNQFLGWWIDGEEFTEDTVCNFEGDKTVVARWKENDKPEVKYTVTFDSNGGTSVSPLENVSFGSKIQEPTGVTKTGYTLEGWYNGGELWNFDSKSVTTDLNLVASWKAVSYTISYELDGGENSSSNPSEYTIESETITFENATKAGYSFRGWYLDGEFKNKVTEIASGSTGNVTIYAYFEFIDVKATCTVYVDYKLPKIISSLYENEQTVVQQYSHFTLRQFSNTNLANFFLGYYYLDENSNEVKIEANVIEITKTGELHIYAKWDEESIYKFYSTSSLVFELDTTKTYAILAGYNGIDSLVVIPEYYTYNGINYAVSRIKNDCFNGNKDVVTVYINAKNVSIGARAFANSTLTYLDFTNVSSVDANAFSNSNLKEAVFEKSFVKLEGSAFRDAKELTKVDFFNADQTFTNIPSYAFMNCVKLKDVRLKYSVSYIDSYSFANCESLENIDFLKEASRTLTICNEVFRGCKSLKNITIFENIKYIGEMVFDGCSNIDIVSMYDLFNGTNTSFYNIFGDTSVKTINLLGENITEIEDGYFSSIETLLRFDMGNSVQIVGSYAFSGCYSLDTIVLSNALIPSEFKINSYMDTPWCQNLTEMLVSGDTLVYVPANEKFVNVSLPSSITIIGESALYQNDVIESIRIPASVTIIKYQAFAYCSNLKTVKFEAGSNLETICTEAFVDCTSLVNFDLSVCTKLTEVEEFAFKNVGVDADMELEIALPKSLTKLGQGVFEKMKIKNFVSNSSNFIAEDGTLYGANSSGEKISIIYFKYNYEDVAFVIPSTVKELYTMAFSYPNKLKYVFVVSDIRVNKMAFGNKNSIIYVLAGGTVKNLVNYNKLSEFEAQELEIGKYTFTETESGYKITVDSDVTEGCYYIQENGRYYLIYVNFNKEIISTGDVTAYKDLILK